MASQNQSVYYEYLAGYARNRWQAIVRERALHAKARRQERLEARARAGKLGPPHGWIYYPLIGLAVTADLFGFFVVPLELTGVGAIFVALISLVISSFFFMVSIPLNRRIKGARNLGKELNTKISLLERQIQLYRQRLATAVRYGRRLARHRTFLRTTWKRKVFLKSLSWIGSALKATRRVLKYGQFILEAIPFINALPWYTINMVLIYREHLQEYRDTLATVKEYQEVDDAEEGAFTEVQGAAQNEVVEVLDATQEGPEDYRPQRAVPQRPAPSMGDVRRPFVVPAPAVQAVT